MPTQRLIDKGPGAHRCPECGCPYPGDHTLDCRLGQLEYWKGKDKQAVAVNATLKAFSEFMGDLSEAMGKLSSKLGKVIDEEQK